MSDVLDLGRSGVCPSCIAPLEPPELRYDDTGVAYLDGPGSFWCPVCGWDGEPEKAP